MTKKPTAREQIEAMRVRRIMKSVERADKRIAKAEKNGGDVKAAGRMNPRHFRKLKEK